MLHNARRMYTCINCGARVDELYRSYSPSVLKVLKCETCDNLADKYIEYDPVIVLVDLILLNKPAYRHLLYNSDFSSYWKLMILLILSESLRKWASYADAQNTTELFDRIFEGERNFYILFASTTISLATFVCAVLLVTEIKWMILGKRPRCYTPIDLVHALTIGGCAKLLGLLEIIWKHVSPEPHQILIYGYTVLCLLTAYSVVCESGRIGSLIGLAGGLLAHNYAYNVIPGKYLSTTNVSMLQS